MAVGMIRSMEGNVGLLGVRWRPDGRPGSDYQHPWEDLLHMLQGARTPADALVLFEALLASSNDHWEAKEKLVMAACQQPSWRLRAIWSDPSLFLIDLDGNRGKNAFHLLCEHGLVDNGETPATLLSTLQALRDIGLAERPLSTGETVLMNAARFCGAPVFETFLEHFGSSLHARDQLDRTALHHAAEKAQPLKIAPLLKAGADPRARSFTGWTPLISVVRQTTATQTRFPEVMECARLLIEDPRSTDDLIREAIEGGEETPIVAFMRAHLDRRLMDRAESAIVARPL